MDQQEWEKLSAAGKKRQLYIRQKQLLDMFFEKSAISKNQYDKSLGDFTEKMGMQDLAENGSNGV